MPKDMLTPEAVVIPVADPGSHLALGLEPTKRISIGVRVANLIAVTIPFAALILAVVSFWGRGFSWIDFGLLVAMYVLTVLGITVGYHRLFTHRAFATSAVVEFILGAMGSMAVQGRLFTWVALHRRHHQHSDEINDPHSPHQAGAGVLGVLHGLWHAHIGWLFGSKPLDLPRYVKDLSQSRHLRVVDRLFFVWVAAGMLIPAAVGGLLTQSWVGALWGFVWGGLVRVLLVHHVTWSINSVCHLWGRRPYQSGDESRNNFLFGVLALGEGWHNTHHAFPTSARHGLQWWQPDVSYWIIRSLAAVGLAWNLKLPSLSSLSARETSSEESGPWRRRV